MPDGRLPGEFDNPSDQVFAFVVIGMGFSGKHQLDRVFGMGDQPDEPFGILEQQTGPFVGRKPPGKTDGQNPVIQGACHFIQQGSGRIAPFILGRQQLAAFSDQVGPVQFVHMPQVDVVDVVNTGNQCRLRLPLNPVGSQIAFQQRVFVAGNIGIDVHAVGDMGDGNFLSLVPGPQSLPHLPGHLPVKPADPVDVS